MSWSVFAIGKPAAVAVKVEADLAAFNCVKPEESVKRAACGAILAAVNAQASSGCCVRVTASGHQGSIYDASGKEVGIQNNLQIHVEPIFGFVE